MYSFKFWQIHIAIITIKLEMISTDSQKQSVLDIVLKFQRLHELSEPCVSVKPDSDFGKMQSSMVSRAFFSNSWQK